MFCENCGAKISGNDLYCSACGHPVKNRGQNVKQRQDGSNRNESAKEMQADAKKSSSIVLYIGIGALIVILLGAISGGVWLLIGSKSSSTGESSGTVTATPIESVASMSEPADVESAEAENAESPEAPPEGYESAALENEVTVKRITYNGSLLSSYGKVIPVEAAATSTISQEGVDNTPMRMMDGNDESNWEEGVAGDGINEQATFRFDHSYNIKYLTFKLGNWKTDRYFNGNNKPKTLTLIFDNGGEYQVTFPSQREEYMVELSNPISSELMTVRITEVYPGTDWDDTCITEIGVYGS